jgi:hypothetical protein
MATVGRLAAVLFGVVAAVGPTATLSSAESLDPAYGRGLARASDGWVVSGGDALARVDERMQPVRQVETVIPAIWKRRGFDRIGDIDVAGTTLYVPFERGAVQSGDERAVQAMARYDADTLTFRDATPVTQHENSFVAVDGDSGIAYSMDRSSGDELLRYDTRAGWRRLAPLQLDRALTRVRGGAVARDAVWLATGDDHNGVYRVSIDEGVVAEVGSVPPTGGEAGGVDAAEVSSGDLHTTVLTADRAGVTLDHFRVNGEPDDGRALVGNDETTWPPALVYFAIALLIAALGAVGTVFYRARTTLRPK